MKKLVPILVLVLLFIGFADPSSAQVPSVVKLNLGLGGGLTAPVGDLGDSQKSGYNVGAKLRVSGLLPIKLVGTVYYMKLKGKEFGTPPFVITAEDGKIIQVGAGLEYQLVPAPIVKPYIGADILYNNLDFGGEKNSRFGVGVGGGVEFNMGGMLHLDGTVKYQFLNLIGKEDVTTPAGTVSEDTNSQVVATISLMFSLM